MVKIEIEMPDKCSECRFRTEYEFCSAMPKNFCGNTSDEGKPDWCPLKNADGWISVKDRLPKSMINKVLVWLKHEDLNSYIGYGHYEKFHGEEMWYDLEHNERFDKRGYIVTHWMPLPEPPKEEKDAPDRC